MTWEKLTPEQSKYQRTVQEKIVMARVAQDKEDLIT